MLIELPRYKVPKSKPMKNKKGYALLALFLSMSIISCSKNDDTIEKDSIEDINLEETLIDLYGTLDPLILPQSNAYAEIPSDPQNSLTADKVVLGKLLFHETGIALSPKMDAGKGTYSCASCHHAKAGFQSGMKQGIGEGGIGFGFKGESRSIATGYISDSLDVQPLRSPTVLNSAFQQVMLWNGQFGAKGPNEGTEAEWTVGTPKEKNNLGFEGVEIQAIAGLGVHRLKVDSTIVADLGYQEMFDAVFPDVNQNQRYTIRNAGLAIAAYERTVMPNKAPFQLWLNGDKTVMSDQEKKGAQLFFGKANCFSCHSGPALNAMEFHALGMGDLEGVSIHGVVDAATKKGRGGFTKNPADDYKFKTPTIYNLKDVEFLGHGGSFSSVKEVIEYKNIANAQNTDVPSSQLSNAFIPLNLTAEEVNQLTAFVENALYDKDLDRFVPESLPSGTCFPNADPQSKADMGCD